MSISDPGRNRLPTSGELYPEQALTRVILEASFAVHNTLGAGFLERIYGAALCLELRANGIVCAREVRYRVQYRGEVIGDYVADLVVEGRVLIEVKAPPRSTVVTKLRPSITFA